MSTLELGVVGVYLRLNGEWGRFRGVRIVFWLGGAMLERIEKGTDDWEYLERLWDKWKEKLRSHRLDMAWCSLESALVGRDAYFKLNKADNGAHVRGGVVIGDGYFDNRVRVAEGSLVIGSDVASTSGKEFVIDGYVEESSVTDSSVFDGSVVVRSVVDDSVVRDDSCVAGSYVSNSVIEISTVESAVVKDSKVGHSSVVLSVLLESDLSTSGCTFGIVYRSSAHRVRLTGEEEVDEAVVLSGIDLRLGLVGLGGFIKETRIGPGTGVIAKSEGGVEEVATVKVTDEVPSGVFAADGLALVSIGGRNGMVGFDFRERSWVSSGETGLMKDVCDYVNEDLEEYEEEPDESGLDARLGFRLLSGQLANFIAVLEALGFDRDLRLRGVRR